MKIKFFIEILWGILVIPPGRNFMTTNRTLPKNNGSQTGLKPGKWWISLRAMINAKTPVIVP
jgi:hypothetical protein